MLNGAPKLAWFKGKALRAGQPPLEMLVLQATPFCNINCDYCYLPNRKSTTRFDLSLIPILFSRLEDAGLLGDRLTVLWHAGEPLILPVDFYEQAFSRIADLAAHRCKITQAIQSNGLLLSDAFCSLFGEYDVHIGISVDGPKFIHDLNRKSHNGRGTFEKVMESVTRLQKHGLPFTTLAVLTHYSLCFPDEMFKFFASLGATEIGFNVEEIESANKNSSLQSLGAQKAFRVFMSRFYRLNALNGFPLSVREFDRLRISIIGGTETFSTLPNPLSIISVDARGNYSTFSPELLGATHPRYENFIFGNVRYDAFQNIAENPLFLKINHEIQAGIRMCQRNCEYYPVCGGGSPSNKLFEKGTFATDETMMCRLTKKTLSDILLDEIESEVVAFKSTD